MKTPLRILERNAKWRRNNPEKLRILKARWYRANATRISAINAERQGERVMANKEYYKKFPEKLRARWLKSDYGMTLNDYNVLLEKQNGKCAICRLDHVDAPWERLHVDHCHSSEKIRGLLCGHCNRMLGLAKDSPATLIAAANYLKRTGGEGA